MPTVGSATLLVVDEKMSETLAYEITRAVLDHTAELAAIHPVARMFIAGARRRGIARPVPPGRHPLLPGAGRLGVVTPDPLAAGLLEAPEPEAATRTLRGPARWLARVLSIGLAVYGLYWVVAILDAHLYRTSFLLMALAATLPAVSGAADGPRRPAVAPRLGAGGAVGPRPRMADPRPRRLSLSLRHPDRDGRRCWGRRRSCSSSRRRGARRDGSSPRPPRSSSSMRTSARCSTSSG